MVAGSLKKQKQKGLGKRYPEIHRCDLSSSTVF